MLDKQDSLLSSYFYELDQELIAQVPVEPRHDSRLLIVDELSDKSPGLRHSNVWDLQKELRSGDLIVLNDTRVMKARLRVTRPTGSVAELLLLEPFRGSQWHCLAKPGKKIRCGDSLALKGNHTKLISLKVIEKNSDSGVLIIEFPSQYSNRDEIDKLLEEFGEVPLPPYIHQPHSNDSSRYQTTYAERPGAVAAPTAGLHLSNELLEALERKGVRHAKLTLHVGLGTFRPIEKEDLQDLKLHSEWIDVREDVVQAVQTCRSQGGRVIAIGTTSVRALEAAYLAGGNNLCPLQGNIDLVIKPGYQFGVVDGLLTNFHLPKSSLLLLVSALLGRERLLNLYAEAIKKKYRFFSFGDAMWISPESVLPQARPRLIE